MKFVKNDEAVSPVIGVILMVAIVVILAAVIAAFVFGMAGTTTRMHNVAATAQLVGNNTVVTYQGGPDHLQLDQTNTPLIATFYGPTGAALTANKLFQASVLVGDTAAAAHTAGGTDHVVVTAKFLDGTQQVILDARL